MPTQRTLEIADEIADAVFDVWNSYDAPDDRPLAQLMREGFEDWEDGVEVAPFVEALESAGGDDALLAIKGVILFRSWDDLTEEEIENETAKQEAERSQSVGWMRRVWRETIRAFVADVRLTEFIGSPLDLAVELIAAREGVDTQTFTRRAVRERCRSALQASRDPGERALLVAVLEEGSNEMRGR